MKNTYRFLKKEYRSAVGVDGNSILIWIEKLKNHWLFGNYFERVSAPKLFTIIDGEDRIGCSINGVFLNRTMTLQEYQRNVDSFDLDKEINIVYNDYLTAVSNQEKLNNKIEKLTS